MRINYIPLLRPNMSVLRISDITPAMLREHGITTLVFDVDNTLVPHLGNRVDNAIVQHIKKLKRGPIKKIYIASNSRRDLKAIAQQLDATIISSTRLSRKPLRHHYRKILKEIRQSPDTVAMIGDKLLTDVLGGNLAGMHTILVAPFRRIKEGIETTVPGVGATSLKKESRNLISDAKTWAGRLVDQTTPRGLRRLLWFTLAVTGLAIFGSILESIQDQEVIVTADLIVSEFLLDHRVAWLTELFTVITAAAGAYAITLLVAVWFFLLVGKKHRRVAFILVIGALLQALLVAGTKLLVGRERPDFMAALVEETTYSFPSGHVMAATVVWGIAAYLIARTLRATYQRLIVGVLYLLVILAVALSRIYLGVHFASDTLASIGLGIGLIALYIAWISGDQQRLPSRILDSLLRRRLIVGFLLVLFVVLLRPSFFL